MHFHKQGIHPTATAARANMDKLAVAAGATSCRWQLHTMGNIHDHWKTRRRIIGRAKINHQIIIAELRRW
jgi:hypothetical protein